jgi:hypothetical protein
MEPWPCATCVAHGRATLPGVSGTDKPAVRASPLEDDEPISEAQHEDLLPGAFGPAASPRRGALPVHAHGVNAASDLSLICSCALGVDGRVQAGTDWRHTRNTAAQGVSFSNFHSASFRLTELKRSEPHVAPICAPYRPASHTGQCRTPSRAIWSTSQLRPTSSSARIRLIDYACSTYRHLQVGGEIREAQLRKVRGAPCLPGDRLRLPAPLTCGQLPSRPPSPPDAVLVQQPPHRHPMGAKLGGDLGKQPPA